MNRRPALPPPPFLYPIVDVAALRGRSPAEAVAALARGGATLVQLRAKAVSDHLLLGLAADALAAARQLGVTFIVNDRCDIALILGADGVHLGQDDLPAAAARTLLGPRALIGVSAHDLAQVGAAALQPIDYVALGPIFPTSSKANPDAVVGLETLRKAAALVRQPLVAIGGITEAAAREVARAGAAGVAVISALLDRDDLTAAAADFRAALLAETPSGASPGPGVTSAR